MASKKPTVPLPKNPNPSSCLASSSKKKKKEEDPDKVEPLIKPQNSDRLLRSFYGKWYIYDKVLSKLQAQLMIEHNCDNYVTEIWHGPLYHIDDDDIAPGLGLGDGVYYVGLFGFGNNCEKMVNSAADEVTYFNERFNRDQAFKFPLISNMVDDYLDNYYEQPVLAVLGREVDPKNGYAPMPNGNTLFLWNMSLIKEVELLSDVPEYKNGMQALGKYVPIATADELDVAKSKRASLDNFLPSYLREVNEAEFGEFSSAIHKFNDAFSDCSIVIKKKYWKRKDRDDMTEFVPNDDDDPNDGVQYRLDPVESHFLSLVNEQLGPNTIDHDEFARVMSVLQKNAVICQVVMPTVRKQFCTICFGRDPNKKEDQCKGKKKKKNENAEDEEEEEIRDEKEQEPKEQEPKEQDQKEQEPKEQEPKEQEPKEQEPKEQEPKERDQEKKPIYSCEFCSVSVHEKCYPVTLDADNLWICQSCEVAPGHPDRLVCTLCKDRNIAGPMAYGNGYGHFVCLWLANKYINQPTGQKFFSEAKQYDNSVCVYCSETGTVFGCTQSECESRFHASCAAINFNFVVTDAVARPICDKHPEMGNFRGVMRLPTTKPPKPVRVCLKETVLEELDNELPIKENPLFYARLGQFWFYRLSVLDKKKLPFVLDHIRNVPKKSLRVRLSKITNTRDWKNKATKFCLEKFLDIPKPVQRAVAGQGLPGQGEPEQQAPGLPEQPELGPNVVERPPN